MISIHRFHISDRSLLSVTQDLLLFSSDTLESFTTAALEFVNQYANLRTLVALKIANMKLREKYLTALLVCFFSANLS
jgi:hypothetical protein|tara:strand:+ start:517 stop:750 length:234 start_codon:yes stop_codon:yes gene_type:complete